MTTLDSVISLKRNQTADHSNRKRNRKRINKDKLHCVLPSVDDASFITMFPLEQKSE